MTLPLGKVALILGAGVFGSVLAKDVGLPSTSDVISGFFKIWKGLDKGESTKSIKKPRSDALKAQVDILREQLETLTSRRPVAIITSTGTGSGKYGAIVIVIVVGYGYLWWKGWKLPDFMFATRRSLSEARATIANQLVNVHSSISATKSELSSRINNLDNNLEEVAELTVSTKETISGIGTDVEAINLNVAIVRGAVENLETKIGRMEFKQSKLNVGIISLCDYESNMDSSESTGYIQASPATSRATLEAAPVTPLSRMNSLPSRGSLLELASSSSSNGHYQESNGDRSSTPRAPNAIQTPESTTRNQSLGLRLLSGRPSGIASSLFSSLGNVVLPQVRLSSQRSS